MKIKKLQSDAIIPAYATCGSAGLDLAAIANAVINPGESTLIGTGLAVQIPQGYTGMVCSRSGLAAKHNINVLNAPGIIDSDYTGELKVILYNHGKKQFKIAKGDRIAQLVITHVYCPALEEVTTLEKTDRGEGGFGSTGIGSSPIAPHSPVDACSDRVEYEHILWQDKYFDIHTIAIRGDDIAMIFEDIESNPQFLRYLDII